MNTTPDKCRDHGFKVGVTLWIPKVPFEFRGYKSLSSESPNYVSSERLLLASPFTGQPRSRLTSSHNYYIEHKYIIEKDSDFKKKSG